MVDCGGERFRGIREQGEPHACVSPELDQRGKRPRVERHPPGDVHPDHRLHKLRLSPELVAKDS